MSSYTVIRPHHDPKYTLFVPWSRLDYAEKVLGAINDMELPHKDMEVVFYVDSDDEQLNKRLNEWCVLNQFVYNGVMLVRSGQPPPPDYNPMPRRSRIVRMKQDSKQYIHASEYVFCLEDDTTAPSYAFTNLLKLIRKRPQQRGFAECGFVQGVQQGRWGLNIIGAWYFDNVANPTRCWTATFNQPQNPVEIDAGGMFCYLTPVKLYKEHDYHNWAAEPGGLDMTYGLELRRQGYTCLMDMSVICAHHTSQGILVPSPQSIISIKWEKVGEQWVRQEPNSGQSAS